MGFGLLWDCSASGLEVADVFVKYVLVLVEKRTLCCSDNTRGRIDASSHMDTLTHTRINISSLMHSPEGISMYPSRCCCDLKGKYTHFTHQTQFTGHGENDCTCGKNGSAMMTD